MTKRATALALARIAGYHEDTAGFTRLCIEKRVARPEMLNAFANGRTAKANGMRCDCYQCKQAKGGK